MNTLTPRSAEEIQCWLTKWIASELNMDDAQINLKEPIVEMGLTSLQAVSLSSNLEDWAGLQLDPTVAWDYPTIAELSAFISAQISHKD